MNDPAPPNSGHAGHTHGHGWMMMICCIPMIVIAIALVASGTVNASFLLFAAMCAGMMFMMMRGMGGGGHDGDKPS